MRLEFDRINDIDWVTIVSDHGETLRVTADEALDIGMALYRRYIY